MAAAVVALAAFAAPRGLSGELCVIRKPFGKLPDAAQRTIDAYTKLLKRHCADVAVITSDCGHIGTQVGVLQHYCVADAMAERSKKKYTGVVYAHADMWFHPKWMDDMLKKDPDVGILVAGGYDPSEDSFRPCGCGCDRFGDRGAPICANSVEEFVQQPWVQEKVAQEAPQIIPHQNIFAKVREVSGNASAPACFAWSDMWRLPGSAYSKFVWAARKGGSMAGLMHEVAVPTLINGLSKRRKDVRCWGGTYHTTDDAADVMKHPCGHRMRLSSPSVAEAVEKIANGVPTPVFTQADMKKAIEENKLVSEARMRLKTAFMGNHVMRAISELSDRLEMYCGKAHNGTMMVPQGPNTRELMSAWKRVGRIRWKKGGRRR
eukprot:TRINITY_DN42918_c0_g1_i1.p1 TRINITY_DN42918_c0_g1~~TRINITY_DN42918_c0_g1_i1.p1  ORF type:complete len:395 (+),score=131.91 TRINITY_DN42918_c0_g1_i1:58-1185(+)